MDRRDIEEVRRRVGVGKKMSHKADLRILKWIAHVGRTSEERLTKIVYESEV